MLCLACSSPSSGPLCDGCLSTLRPAPDRSLPTGLRVVAGYSHEGAARRLVHRLKYHPVVGVAEYLAAAMAERADGIDALVPVPRASLRRWRSGVDPASELAGAVGRILGRPVVHALAAPLWWPRHAGRERERRAPVRFRAAVVPDGALALVDDVVTTGTTLQSAATVLGAPALAVVATSAGRVALG
jgi:predicted amidophosphoribosyltransferase